MKLMIISLNTFKKFMVFSVLLLNEKQYKIGVYSPRQICIALADKMLTTSSFVSDMSSGFTGNCGYPLPKNWAFDQFLKLHLPLLHHLQSIKLPVLPSQARIRDV
ncbi:MAG: glycoside hydrolase domain-containing protein [Clostridia bacterium]